jgi:hypothetical protein
MALQHQGGSSAAVPLPTLHESSSTKNNKLILITLYALRKVVERGPMTRIERVTRIEMGMEIFVFKRFSSFQA